MKSPIISSAVVAVFSLGLSLPGMSIAQDRQEPPAYGSQLMTEQERLDFRERMRSAQSAEDQQRVRAEHHERMEERARERGVDLSDETPRGGGQLMGREGMGAGDGMNQNGNRMNNRQRMEDRGRLQDSEGNANRSRMPDERNELMHDDMPRSGVDSYDRRQGKGMGSGGGGSRY